jgi:TPR repeat protein
LPKDLSRARALWTEGCDEGYATACFNVANLDWLNDKTIWQARMSRGCDLKSGLACVRLGEAHASGDLGVVDHTRAAQYFELACELGRASGCRMFASALRAGRGTTADPERAKEVDRRACELLHKDDQGAANCF